jgi:hypothetical protein
MRYSEGLDPEADAFDPDLAPVEFDDAAMAEALGDSWDEADDDDGCGWSAAAAAFLK